MPLDHQFVLTIACRDTKGIVHAVSGLLYQAGCNIIDSQQFGDLEGDDATGLFFMRVHFQAPPQLATPGTLQALFEHTRQQFGMQVNFHSLAARPRLLLMVSQHGHCLNDLLYRWKSGSLAVDIPAIVSNHRAFEDLAASHGIPFHHLPLPAGGDAANSFQAGLDASFCEIDADFGHDSFLLAHVPLTRLISAFLARVAREENVALPRGGSR